MSSYCPAGKMECERWNGRGCVVDAATERGFSDVALSDIEVCHWPSRQVPVRPYAEDCAAQEAEKPATKVDPMDAWPPDRINATRELFYKLRAGRKIVGRVGCNQSVIYEVLSADCHYSPATRAKWLERIEKAVIELEPKVLLTRSSNYKNYQNARAAYCKNILKPALDAVTASIKSEDSPVDPAAAGRLAGLREAREGVEQLAETHPDINVSADNGWVKLSVILAAIDRLMGGK
jgi:hypothetical protein